jgi:ubiquitin-conjugating enzyme E2 C
MANCSGISAFPENDNLFHWSGTVSGATGTVYEGMAFKITMKFPSNYPYSPPSIKFDTKCFHPNVDQYGNICLDILKVLIALADCRFLNISLGKMVRCVQCRNGIIVLAESIGRFDAINQHLILLIAI